MSILLALIAWPVIEIAVFILVGGWIGLWPTLALVLLSFMGGITLLRGLGSNAGAQIRGAMMAETDPAGPLISAAMTFIAGMLLILPGFVSDIVALVLLVPSVQATVFRLLRTRARAQGSVWQVRWGNAAAPRPAGDRVIDGTFTEVTPDNGNRPPSRWSEP